jgi:hypothetical protein
MLAMLLEHVAEIFRPPRAWSTIAVEKATTAIVHEQRLIPLAPKRRVAAPWDARAMPSRRVAIAVQRCAIGAEGTQRSDFVGIENKPAVE